MLLTNRKVIALQETLGNLIGNSIKAFRDSLSENYSLVSTLVGNYQDTCNSLQESLDALHIAELVPFEEAKQVLQHKDVIVDAKSHVSLSTAQAVAVKPPEGEEDPKEKAETIEALEAEYKASLDKRNAILSSIKGLLEQEVTFTPITIPLLNVPIEIIGAYKDQVNLLIDSGIVVV